MMKGSTREKLFEVMEQLRELKAANAQLRDLKVAEQKHQREYFRNCQKVITVLKDKRKDFVLDQLSMIDSSVSQISLDVQAFKNIRNRLFSQITDEISKEQDKEKSRKHQPSHAQSNSVSSQTRMINNNKLYLYLFHLFESVISNVSQLVAKTMQTTIREC